MTRLFAGGQSGPSLLLLGLLLILNTCSYSLADKDFLLRFIPFNLACSGLYSQNDIYRGDPASAKISIVNSTYLDSQAKANLSLIAFDWKDEAKLGVNDTMDSSIKIYVCDERAVNQSVCTPPQLGLFLTGPNTTVPNDESSSIRTWLVPMENRTAPLDLEYPVNSTGYICVMAVSPGPDFYAEVEWTSAHGKLPTKEYPKLIFYAALSFTYLAIGIAWTVKSLRHREEILPTQNYICYITFFLCVEMAFQYGYYEDYNSRGEYSNILVVLLSILNAARNSLSFFLLLIVALGYGVLKPSLGDELKKIKLLTLAHFLAGVNYSAGTMLVRPDTDGLLVLWFVLPLSLSMTTFYFWILNGLTETVQSLEKRRQYEKLKMYNRLWLLLVVSIILLAGFFVFNSADFAHRYETAWQADHWRTQWFLLDGWLNLEYFLIFLGIAWLWRPTGENQRYGLQELPGDERDVFDATALEEEDGVRVDGAGGEAIEMGKRHPGSGDGSAVFDIGEEDLGTSDEEEDDVHGRDHDGVHRHHIIGEGPSHIGRSHSPNPFDGHNRPHSPGDLERGPAHVPLSSTQIWGSGDEEEEEDEEERRKKTASPHH